MDTNFNKISAAIVNNEKYENIIHEVCHMPHVTNLTEFYELCDLEQKAIEKKYGNQSKAAPTSELFAEVFKKLEEYPANLQRPKKVYSMRERLNSNASKSSQTLNDSACSTAINQNKESSILLNLTKADNAPVPTVSETLNSFIKFQKQLRQLNDEIMDQDLEKEYAHKLKQLSIFAQQLEKLLPTEKVAKSALSIEEESILEDLVSKMDDFNFICSRQKVFLSQQSEPSNSVSSKLEDLVDILSYCLLAVKPFNNIN